MEQAETEYAHRDCPTCRGSKSRAIVRIFSKLKAESLQFDAIQSYWSGFFKEKSFFSYYRCLCGLLYCPLFFTNEQLNFLYKNMADNTAGVPISVLFKTQEGYFKTLKKYSTLEGGYLELGPDIGLFTAYCIKEANFNQYWLCEPNREVWPELRKKVLVRPHAIFPGMEDIEIIPNKSLSTVAMIHVLDHLLAPAELLEKIKNKLAPGAILIIVTHDEKSLLAKVTKSKWPPYCLQHPQLYNIHSISKFLNNSGFSVLACKKTRNYFPLTYLIKHISYLVGLKKLSLPKLDKLQLGLKLGNMITVAKLN